MKYDLFLQNLKKAREESGFSQREIGARVRLSAGQINNIEKGRCSLKIETYFEMCKAFQLSPDTLMNPMNHQDEKSFLAEKMGALSARDFNIIKDLIMLMELSEEDL